METELEKLLTSSYKDGMISFMESHPESFDEAFELALVDKQPLSWRAAWLLWSCLKENDERIKKYTGRIISGIKSKNDGHQRELLKILLLTNLNKTNEGLLFDLCMDIWEQINKDPSVRYTALKMISKIAGRHPELKEEIKFLAREEFRETLSPGIKKVIDRMMDEFNNSSLKKKKTEGRRKKQ